VNVRLQWLVSENPQPDSCMTRRASTCRAVNTRLAASDQSLSKLPTNQSTPPATDVEQL